jgi:hypothetical protein
MKVRHSRTSEFVASLRFNDALLHLGKQLITDAIEACMQRENEMHMHSTNGDVTKVKSRV